MTHKLIVAGHIYIGFTLIEFRMFRFEWLSLRLLCFTAKRFETIRCFFRAWHNRRVIASKDVIVFAKPDDGGEHVIDAIPLFEVDQICVAQYGEDSIGLDDFNQGSRKLDLEKKNANRCSNMSGDPNQVKFRNSFQIRTSVDGYNSGRTYYIKATSEEQCAEILTKLAASARASRQIKEAKTRFRASQERVREMYRSSICQGIVAAMIVAVPTPPLTRSSAVFQVTQVCWASACRLAACADFTSTAHARTTATPLSDPHATRCTRQNFVVNAVATQYNDLLSLQGPLNATSQPDAAGSPAPSSVQQLADTLDSIDTSFTVIFTAELLVNLYAHWFWRFWRDGWSVFDFGVISMSLIALGPVDMPVSVIRLMRTFRVVRLFGRMKALRQIILALTASLIPVTNAFFILIIVISICEPRRGRAASTHPA